MNKNLLYLQLILCGVIAAAVSCASGGSDKDSGNSSSSTSSTSSSSGNSSSSSTSTSSGISSSSSGERFSTDCGIVSGGVLVNSGSAVSVEELTFVRADASNVIIARSASGSDVGIKLHALKTNGRVENRAKEYVQDLIGPGSPISFVQAIKDCRVTLPSGGVTLTGQVFTSSGVSVIEELIKAGLAGEIETGGSCGEGLISPCLTALREENTQNCAGQIDDFLWKPMSDGGFNPGQPVVLVDVCNATVFVNGREGKDFGPGSGRCNTTRLFGSCSSFGSNIKVEVIDNDTGVPYCDGDKTSVTVPNGCSRFEFKR